MFICIWEDRLAWRLGWDLLIINQQIKYYYFNQKRHLLLSAKNLLRSLFQAARQCIKNHDNLYLCDVAIVCWIPTRAVHWFNVLKAVAIQTSEQLNLSMTFVVSHFLIATFKVSPEWKLKSRYWNQKKCPRCPFNRGNKDKDYVNIFPGPNFVSLNGGVPWIEVSQKEKFHGTRSKGWLNSLRWKTLDSCSVMQCLKFIFSTCRPGLESL